MIFTAPGLDALADVLHDFRETVRADVRVGIDENLRACAEVHELVEHLSDVTPLRGAGEELSVGERAGSAFAVAEVGLRIQDSLAGEFRHIELAVAHVLAPLQNDRLEAEGQELEGGEHSGGTGSDDDHGVGVGDILIFRNLVRDVRFKAVVVALDAVAVDHIVAGVDRTFGDHAGRVGVREGRLVGLCRVNHVDDRVAAEVHLSRRDYPHVIRPEVTANPTCHFKFNHILFLKADFFLLYNINYQNFKRSIPFTSPSP